MDLLKNILDKTDTVNRDDFLPNGSIRLQDDGDGIQYIAEWKHSESIPNGFVIGK